VIAAMIDDCLIISIIWFICRRKGGELFSLGCWGTTSGGKEKTVVIK